MTKKIENSIYVGSFLLLLGAFLLLWCSLDAQEENIEKRQLAKKPELTGATIEGFPAAYEAYYNDHFPFRNHFYQWFNRWKVEALQNSPKPKSVVLGKDNWLFYSSEKVLDNYRSWDVLETENLEYNREILQERADWCREKELEVLFVLAPNKHSIYPQRLPDWVKKRQAATLSDQVMSLKISGLPFLDLRPRLLEGKKRFKVYHQYDTHWNELGACLAADEISARLLPDPMRSMSDYQPIDTVFQGGDLAQMLGLQNQVKEQHIHLRALFHSTVRKDTLLESQFNQDIIAYYNPTADNDYRVLMLGDSYSNGLRRFLKENFRQTIFIRDHHFNKKLIEKIDPDILLLEYVERYLHHLNWQ